MSLDRIKCLRLCGYRLISPGFRENFNRLAEANKRARKIINSTFDRIIEEVLHPEGEAEVIADLLVPRLRSVFNREMDRMNEILISEMNLLEQVVTLRNELAELKADVIMAEDVEALAEISLGVARRLEDRDIRGSISYLDPDKPKKI